MTVTDDTSQFQPELESIDRRKPSISLDVAGGAFLADGFVRLATERWHHVQPALSWLNPAPLEIHSDGSVFTLGIQHGQLHVDSRGQAETSSAGGESGSIAAVEFSSEQLKDILEDEVTPMGLFSAGKLRRLDASLELLFDWWLILRAVVDNEAIHVPGSMEFTAADGSPLDLATQFHIDDDPAAMNRFLTQCGYLHIADAFSTEHMDQIWSDMDEFAPQYSQGDGKSWWATLQDGSDALVRMQRFQTHSDATQRILESDVLAKIAELTGDQHQVATGTNPIEALFKPIGVQTGISDVPWHKDCALGRHSYDCCAMTIGISVSGGGAHTGQLKVVAGSHRALVWSSLLREGTDLPVVELPTSAGDVTVHLSCTLHMAQPPTDAERRVMYTSLTLPDMPLDDDTLPDRAHIGEIREAAAVTISQPPSKVPKP